MAYCDSYVDVGTQIALPRGWRIAWCRPQALLPHEQLEKSRLTRLLEQLRIDCALHHALLVDAPSGIVLDGHHRRHAATLLGFSHVPCLLVEYERDNRICVHSWRADIAVTKELVLLAGRSGNLLPPRTSRHSLLGDFKSSLQVPVGGE